MPELPEVETIARTLAAQITNKVIARAFLPYPKSLHAGHRHFAETLPGASILRVFRRAKLLLIETKPVELASLTLVFHLKMTGCFLVHPATKEYDKHTRIVFDFTDSADFSSGRLFFNDVRTFGYCRAMLPEDFPSWPFWTSLGPEPLETPDEELAGRLARHRGSIKAALLNQEIVAGIGNIYADESLFYANIAPKAQASRLEFSRLVVLAASLRRVLLQSIAECGSSIRNYRDANGDTGAFQNSFAVYGRRGAACITCGEILSFARVAGRGTVFCSHCQR